MELPSPAQIKNEYPLNGDLRKFIDSSRETARHILKRTDRRVVAIVGPCSIHDPVSALEYAMQLKKLAPEIEKKVFLIMRLFVEKPRTRMGWKGMLYDPHLDGSFDMATGIRRCREIFVQIAKLGIPCATELLEPLALPYFDDLITWGFIGARTATSQPHRQLASGLPFPVGFKNGIFGEIDGAISGILTSRIPHSHMGINSKGQIAAIQTTGNPFTHLVLRGSDIGPNFDPVSVNVALKKLEEHRLEPRLIIDCAHGNSGKDPYLQQNVYQSVLEQISQGNESIAGVMLESHLLTGKQPLRDNPSLLHYGVSITDSCLGWEETAGLLRSTSISFVQK